MCRTRKDTQAGEPGPRPAPLVTGITEVWSSSSSFAAAAAAAASRSSSLPASSGTDRTAGSTSSYASLASLKDFLPDNWRCTLRERDAVVFQRRFQGDPAALRHRLAAACKIHHASIVRLLGASLGGEHIFLVYEHVNGSSLADCLRNPRSPGYAPLSSWVHRMQAATDLAQGLEYIHHYATVGAGAAPLGPVHNLLSSSSVIISDPQLRAKICHFGAVQLAGEISSSHHSDEETEEKETSPDLPTSRRREVRFEGRSGYISPELLGGGRPSQKSDVFAFGVVLLELLTGEEPVKYRYSTETKEYDRVSLVEAARELAAALERQQKILRWVDRRLVGSFPEEAAERAVRVALDCVRAEPERRPGMERVAGKLSRLLLLSRTWADNVLVSADLTIKVAGQQ
ncbi:unnamed protein product [Spirodela intermedia]|uniref:Protein kinase domain-containing protein n=1 Tax=Spirodela intermedia TaxID=51605 RepID=A0A7I8J8Y7_SPIIN|nr:unnamed protein product [Spirodela intermedia]CAA6666549.1 unnamed protein product [Spirodela intermedia]